MLLLYLVFFFLFSFPPTEWNCTDSEINRMQERLVVLLHLPSVQVIKKKCPIQQEYKFQMRMVYECAL